MDSRGRGSGGLMKRAATPLTNLCSDAGVGRMPGCLDIWYLRGFRWFCFDLTGFTWFSWTPGADCYPSNKPLLGCWGWKIGGLDAWMPGYLVFRWIYVLLLGFRWF